MTMPLGSASTWPTRASSQFFSLLLPPLAIGTELDHVWAVPEPPWVCEVPIAGPSRARLRRQRYGRRDCARRARCIWRDNSRRPNRAEHRDGGGIDLVVFLACFRLLTATPATTRRSCRVLHSRRAAGCSQTKGSLDRDSSVNQKVRPRAILARERTR